MNKYFENPNIPNRQVKCVIMDYRADKETFLSLQNIGIDVIPTTPISKIDKAVCGHADMMIYHLGGDRFVSAPEVYEYYKKALPDADVMKGSGELRADYPNDILYNCASLGNYIICNAAHTATEILKEHKTVINVKQGYAKCSTCIITENAIITADESIAKQCGNNGIDVLKITSGHIELPGMNYGFIGGASGLLSKNVLSVNGELKYHPDGENIKSFCKNYGVDIYELKHGMIKDIGSIIAVC